MPERYASRLKLGVVVPSTNTTLEPDCHSISPPGVTCHTGRILIQERKISGAQAYDAHVQAMREGISDAIKRVVTCAPDRLIMGVALEAFWGGLKGSETLQRDLEQQAGVPVVIGSAALDAALQQFQARKIAILTPHQPAGDAQVEGWFSEAGYQVVRLTGLKCESPRKIAEVSLEQMRAALLELDGPDVDAIVQVGTNLQFVDIAPAAELMFAKPVIAINAAMLWHACRQNGITDPVQDAGRLLKEH